MSRGIGTAAAFVVGMVLLFGLSLVIRGCEQAKDQKHIKEVLQKFDQQKLDDSLVDTDEFLSELMRVSKHNYSITQEDGYDVIDIKEGVWMMAHRVEGDRSYTKGYEDKLYSLTISYDDLNFIISSEGIELMDSIARVLNLDISKADLINAAQDYHSSHKDVDGCYANSEIIKLDSVTYSCETFSKFGDYSNDIHIRVFNEEQAKLSPEIKEDLNK